jgi:hypothetical protein
MQLGGMSSSSVSVVLSTYLPTSGQLSAFQWREFFRMVSEGLAQGQQIRKRQREDMTIKKGDKNVVENLTVEHQWWH